MKRLVTEVDPGGWGSLLRRMFLVVPLAQLVGVLVSTQFLAASGLIAANPRLSVLIVLTGGALTGGALGLLVSPVAGRRPASMMVGAAYGTLTYVVLLTLAELRLPAGSATAPATTYLVGVALLVGVQTLLTWGLWTIRDRQT